VSVLDGGSRDCYVRQLRDWKGSVEIEQMGSEGMVAYARLCAWTLARAHARSGDGIAIAGYVGSGDVLDRSLAAFASLYADQNERDYAALQAAVESGRVRSKSRERLRLSSAFPQGLRGNLTLAFPTNRSAPWRAGIRF
jgi:hypothetical protein